MLGGQVVVTVISALFLRRLPLTFSQKWLFLGVYCYGCPTDQELRAVAGDEIIEQGGNGQSSSSSSNGKGSRKRQNRKMSQESTKTSGATYAVQLFSFPKSNCVSVPLQLQSVLDSDVINWKFWVELKWLLDYMAVTCFAILCSNLYAYAFPKKAQKEFNLTIVWLIIGWMFTARALLKLVAAFFKSGINKTTSPSQDIGDSQNGEEAPGLLNSHEAFICVCSASLMFLCTCFGIILMPRNWLDFEFQTGCKTLVNGLDMFFSNLSTLNISSTASSSSLGVNKNHEEMLSKVSRCKNASVLLVGLYAAVMGLVLTFPLIRLARIHLQMTSQKIDKTLHPCTKVNIMHRTMSHLNLMLPLSLCALWLEPFGWRNFQLLHQMPILSVIKYDTFFLWNLFLSAAVLITAIIKLSTVPVYLRVYLASLREKTNNLITQAGNISNVQYQKIVASHNYYACVVCVQLMAPAAMLFFQLVLMAYSVCESGSLSGGTLSSQGPVSEGGQSPAYSSPSFKFMWKLIPAVLCLNFLKATIFVFLVIHTLFSSLGLLLNFSNQ